VISISLKNLWAGKQENYLCSPAALSVSQMRAQWVVWSALWSVAVDEDESTSLIFSRSLPG
jgi:hypothetical protein